MNCCTATCCTGQLVCLTMMSLQARQLGSGFQRHVTAVHWQPALPSPVAAAAAPAGALSGLVPHQSCIALQQCYVNDLKPQSSLIWQITSDSTICMAAEREVACADPGTFPTAGRQHHPQTSWPELFHPCMPDYEAVSDESDEPQPLSPAGSIPAAPPIPCPAHTSARPAGIRWRSNHSFDAELPSCGLDAGVSAQAPGLPEFGQALCMQQGGRLRDGLSSSNNSRASFGAANLPQPSMSPQAQPADVQPRAAVQQPVVQGPALLQPRSAAAGALQRIRSSLVMPLSSAGCATQQGLAALALQQAQPRPSIPAASYAAAGSCLAISHTLQPDQPQPPSAGPHSPLYPAMELQGSLGSRLQQPPPWPLQRPDAGDQACIRALHRQLPGLLCDGPASASSSDQACCILHSSDYKQAGACALPQQQQMVPRVSSRADLADGSCLRDLPQRPSSHAELLGDCPAHDGKSELLLAGPPPLQRFSRADAATGEGSQLCTTGCLLACCLGLIMLRQCSPDFMKLDPQLIMCVCRCLRAQG